MIVVLPVAVLPPVAEEVRLAVSVYVSCPSPAKHTTVVVPEPTTLVFGHLKPPSGLLANVRELPAGASVYSTVTLTARPAGTVDESGVTEMMDGACHGRRP